MGAQVTKKAIQIISGVLIIGSAGLCIYMAPLLISQGTEGFYLDAQRSYEDTGKSSYLLESTLLRPSRDNLIEITDVLLDEGDFKLAELIHRVTKDPNFYPKAAEAALLNLDLEMGEDYLALTPPSRAKVELTVFAHRLAGDNSSTVEEPITEAGKLLQMIGAKDFSLYELKGEIGKSIQNTNALYPGKINNLLAQGRNLYNNGFYYLALETLEKDPGRCTRDYFLLKGELYSSKKDLERALKTIEEGLTCNPTDEILITKAVDYSYRHGSATKAEYYKQRLDLLLEMGE